jgi:hypothetical protein
MVDGQGEALWVREGWAGMRPWDKEVSSVVEKVGLGQKTKE